MLNINRLTYNELIALARFFLSIERNEEADEVYNYIEEELINPLIIRE
jgi:hypothetical protein